MAFLTLSVDFLLWPRYMLSDMTFTFLVSLASYIVIKGVTEKESEELLNYLKDFSSQEKFIYSHSWEKNDLLIWDNRSILHRGTYYNPKEPRYLVRTTVQDSLSKAKYLN